MKRKRIKAPIKKDDDLSMKRKIFTAIILIGLAFSGAFLIYFIMQIALNTKTPMVVVVSGSMEPALYKGDLLFLKGKDPSFIKNGTIEGKEGDIIVFDARGLPGWINAPNDPVVHRVIAKIYDNGWFFLTKGDANFSPDNAWVPESRIIGVVSGKIPYIGWVKILLTDSGLLLPLLVIVSILLVISLIWDIMKKEEEKNGNKINKENHLIFDPKSKMSEQIREIEMNFTKQD